MDRFVECMALFVKGYISEEDFVNFAYENDDAFEKLLDTDAYQAILDYSPLDKESKNTMYSEIGKCLAEADIDVLNSIHDAYVERIVDSDRTDFWAEYIRKKNAKEKEILIDCALALDGEQLRKLVKTRLGLDDTCCGDSWDAIDDLIFEAKYPEKLVLKNWSNACKNMSEDTKRLSEILTKHGFYDMEFEE